MKQCPLLKFPPSPSFGSAFLNFREEERNKNRKNSSFYSQLSLFWCFVAPRRNALPPSLLGIHQETRDDDNSNNDKSNENSRSSLEQKSSSRNYSQNICVSKFQRRQKRNQKRLFPRVRSEIILHVRSPPRIETVSGESVQNNDSARDDIYASFCRGWHARRVESGAAFGIGRCQLGLDVCEYLPFVAPTRTRAFTKSRRNTQIYREK